MVPYDPAWPDRFEAERALLAFRDALRRDPDLAAHYAGLKIRLARTFALDREACTAARSQFVSRIPVSGTRKAPFIRQVLGRLP